MAWKVDVVVAVVVVHVSVVVVTVLVVEDVVLVVDVLVVVVVVLVVVVVDVVLVVDVVVVVLVAVDWLGSLNSTLAETSEGTTLSMAMSRFAPAMEALMAAWNSLPAAAMVARVRFVLATIHSGTRMV
jgi:hypothetical protein